MGTNSVRRNLFHHHLSRRPGSTTSTAPSTSNGVSGLSSQPLHSAVTEPGSSLSSGPVDNGEIVARDKSGAYKLDIPVLPPVVTEEGDEMEGIEGTGGPGGGGSGVAAGGDSTGPCDMNGEEKEKIEASLIEMMYRNRNRQISSEPHEILNLIQQSLRNKVAALEEDNWMYEPEADTRL